nr:hypothetical protein [Neisseria sicca]
MASVGSKLRRDTRTELRRRIFVEIGGGKGGKEIMMILLVRRSGLGRRMEMKGMGKMDAGRKVGKAGDWWGMGVRSLK